MSGELIALDPDGTVTVVPGTYEGIKAGLHGATLTFLRIDSSVGLYADDEGMLNGARFNVPASMFVGRALWGPVVICRGDPDDEGESVPADPLVTTAAEGIADQWRLVVESARWVGQELSFPVADSGTIPPAQVITFETNDDFMAFLEERDRRRT